MDCLIPPLTNVPDGDWFCTACVQLLSTDRRLRFGFVDDGAPVYLLSLSLSLCLCLCLSLSLSLSVSLSFSLSLSVSLSLLSLSVSL